MITQKDLDEIENRLKESFLTKYGFSEYNEELFNKLDSIVKKYFRHKPGSCTY